MTVVGCLLSRASIAEPHSFGQQDKGRVDVRRNAPQESQAKSVFGKTSHFCAYPRIYYKRVPADYSMSVPADSSMPPPFFFRIDEIREDPSVRPYYDNLGNWIPSIEANVNRRVLGGVSERLWFCNRQQIFEIYDPLPPESLQFKQFSVYFGGGYGFWVLRGDATNPADDEAWHPLRFDHSELDYSSFLTNAGQQPQLKIQRPDQIWPKMLLPDIYHAPMQTTSLAHGGLTGELPILLGLLAISMPSNWLPSELPKLFTGGVWTVHAYTIPRTNQRGVVVTVYTCPPSWAGGSTTADLDRYERGDMGKYYN